MIGRHALTRLLPQSKFSRGVLTISSGIAANQAVVILVSPLISRLYAPEQFGVLAVYSGILGIITVISSLRYQLAIPLPRTDGSALNILALSIAITALTAGITAGALLFLHERVGEWTNTPSVSAYLWLLPLSVLLAGTYQSLSYWAIRKGAFGILARTKLQQSAGMAATQIGFGLAHTGPAGLVLGQVVGQTAGLYRLLRFASKGGRRSLDRLRVARVLQRARRFKRFPVYLSWAGLLNSAGSQLPLILFASIFSPAVAGLFLFAYRLVSRPMALVSQSVRQVFLSGASEAHRNGQLGTLTLSAFRGLVRVGVAPTVLLGISAPEFFNTVFGQAWTEAGHYVQWMVPWLLASFVISPLTTLNVVLERQRAGLLFQAALVIAKLGGLALGARSGNAVLSIAGYSLGACAVYLTFGLWIATAAGAKLRRLLSAILLEVLLVLPIACLLLLIKPDSSWRLDMRLPELSSPWWIALVVSAAGLFTIYRSLPVLYHKRAKAT